VLEPGETVLMPVTFYVDPEIVDDPETAGIPAITLSYTFHVTDMPEDYAALDTGRTGGSELTTIRRDTHGPRQETRLPHPAALDLAADRRGGRLRDAVRRGELDARVRPVAVPDRLRRVLYVMYGWWADVVAESQQGDHTPVVRLGLKYGFIMFIMSEVMFFAAWFWAFFKHAIYPMNTYEASTYVPPEIYAVDPFHLPLINTLCCFCRAAR
jgi:hypothetical protein